MFLLKLKISNYIQHDLGFDPFSPETVLFFMLYFISQFYELLSGNKQNWLWLLLIQSKSCFELKYLHSSRNYGILCLGIGSYLEYICEQLDDTSWGLDET